MYAELSFGRLYPQLFMKKNTSGCSVAFDGLGGFATGWVPKIHWLGGGPSQDEWLVSGDPDDPPIEKSHGKYTPKKDDNGIWNIIFVEVWFRSFSFPKRVICRFQPLIFQGVGHLEGVPQADP